MGTARSMGGEGVWRRVALCDKVILTEPFRPVSPTPAALISSIDARGAANLVTLGEVFNVSIARPVIVGIAVRSSTYSYGLIVASGEFVVNLPSDDLAGKLLQVGSVSGRTGIDKFAAFGLTAIPSNSVAPPLVAECPVNLECRLVSDTCIGDHNLLLGEVVAQHVDVGLLDDNGNIVVDRLHGLSMFCGELWSMGSMVAKHY